jgi:hypothetical protein
MKAQTSLAAQSEQVLSKALEDIGESEAVRRFLNEYGNLPTKPV